MSKYYYKHRCVQDKRATTHNHNSFNFLFIFFKLFMPLLAEERKVPNIYILVMI